MIGAGAGLTAVDTEALKTLLRTLHRGDVHGPLSVEDLARIGLQYCAEDILGHLRGVDDAGLRAVLVAVIAERRSAGALPTA